MVFGFNRGIFNFSLILVCLLILLVEVVSDCLPTIPLILKDIHDGDQKVIKSVEWNTFTIHSYPNTSEWKIEGQWDINCVALINFNVPGKKEHPPVPLKMTMWIMKNVGHPSAVKLGFEFTDPSETLAPKTQPLNIWMSAALSGPALLDQYSHQLQLSIPKRTNHNLQSSTCIYTGPHRQAEIFNDIIEGDMKAITVYKETLSIKPSNTTQKWDIEATFSDDCSTIIDFNVPGYPNPPKAPLQGVVWGMASLPGGDKDALVFSKPTALDDPSNAFLPGNTEKQ